MKRQCKQGNRQVLLLEIACIIQLRLCYTPIINDYMDNSHKHLIHCSHNLRILLVRGIIKFHLEPNSVHSLKSFQQLPMHQVPLFIALIKNCTWYNTTFWRKKITSPMVSLPTLEQNTVHKNLQDLQRSLLLPNEMSFPLVQVKHRTAPY